MPNICSPKIEFAWMTPNPIEQIARKARICYQSEEHSKKTDLELIHMLLYKKHIPMFDHASASFDIITNRGITHEIVRHRVAAYAQESTRYCNYNSKKFNKSISVVQSSKINTQDTREYAQDIKSMESVYMKWINKGYSPQIARDFLPTGVKSQIGVTMSLTSWFHFLDLRLNEGSHPDMIIIAKKILDWFVGNPETAPIFIRAIENNIIHYIYKKGETKCQE